MIPQTISIEARLSTLEWRNSFFIFKRISEHLLKHHLYLWKRNSIAYTVTITLVHSMEFLLRQAFADDEASTRLLQNILLLLLSTASLMFIPCAIRSSFTLSISLVVFLCFLFPPLVRRALLPVVCFPPSLLRARTTSSFFF